MARPLTRKEYRELIDEAVRNPWWTVNSMNEIQSRDVVRETPKWLYFAPMGNYEPRALKLSRSGAWFKTRQEAVEACRLRLMQNLRHAKWQLRNAREELSKFNGRER